MKSHKKRVLIIKLGALGDVCLALTLLEAYPDHHIEWITSKIYAPLLQCTKKINRIIEISHEDLLQGSLTKKILSLLKAWKALAFRQYDVVITAHKDPRYKLLSLLTLKKKHLFFDKGSFFPLGKIFHGAAYLSLTHKKTRPFYRQYDFPKTEFLLPKEKKLILLNVGFDKNQNKHLRLWPLVYYKELAEQLSSYATVGILSQNKDEETSELFKSSLALDFRGKTTMIELASLLDASFGLITHDSGTLHLARCTKTRICALFGPTSLENFSQESEKEFSLKTNKTVICSPCYDGKSFPGCSHQSCMKTLLPTEVLQHLLKRWDLHQ